MKQLDDLVLSDPADGPREPLAVDAGAPPDRAAIWTPWLWIAGALLLGVWSAMMWELWGGLDRLAAQLRADVAALEQRDQELANKLELLRLTANEAASRQMAEDHAREALRRLQPQLHFDLPLARKETEL